MGSPSESHQLFPLSHIRWSINTFCEILLTVFSRVSCRVCLFYTVVLCFLERSERCRSWLFTLKLCDLLQLLNVQWVCVVTYIRACLCRRECRHHRHSHRRLLTGHFAGTSMRSYCLASRNTVPTHCLTGPFSRSPTSSCSCLAVPILDVSSAARYNLTCVQ